MHPFECPVCLGRGLVPKGFYKSSPSPKKIKSKATLTESCRSCSGTGILWGFSYGPTPDSLPWVSFDDGNTTFPPYEITWSSANIRPNKDDDTIAMNPRREI